MTDSQNTERQRRSNAFTGVDGLKAILLLVSLFFMSLIAEFLKQLEKADPRGDSSDE